MSTAAAAPPPSTETKKPQTPSATTTLAPFAAVFGGLLSFSFLYLILFHAGAAYLSYQKYQSGLWALLDFFFPYFYYPYYAFFLSASPAPAPTTLLGGLRKVMGGRRR